MEKTKPRKQSDWDRRSFPYKKPEKAKDNTHCKSRKQKYVRQQHKK